MPNSAGSVTRREAEATETRLKWVEHVVEEAGGACGTIEGVSGGFPGLFVPPREWILAYAVCGCPIRAGFVARGEAEATETRLKWVEHVVEEAGGACGTIEGVSGGFPGRVVPL